MVNGKEPERNFKNNLFIDYIGTKENLIEVYNAVSGKDYSPDTEIEINTLKNVLYRYRINDISFVIDGKLIVLIEHQSTINVRVAHSSAPFGRFAVRFYTAAKAA
jgi:hypothetical protein